MAEAARQDEGSLGEYKGYPILDVKIEWRGLEGGLTDAVKVGSQFVSEPEDFVFIASKGRKIAERYDVVRDDDDIIKGWVLTQVFKALGADFADERIVGAALHATMEKVAHAKAFKKGGQLTLTDPEGVLDEQIAETRGKIRDIRVGVPDDEGASEG